MNPRTLAEEVRRILLCDRCGRRITDIARAMINRADREHVDIVTALRGATQIELADGSKACIIRYAFCDDCRRHQ